MGQTIVSLVIDQLRGADIRADEAYPGSRIPALTGPVAAVRLGKLDRAVRTTAVQVTVMSPASGGGSACEAVALRAVESLQKMDATCEKGICQFDDMADIFYIEITATFFGTALETAWSPGPGYSVTIGVQPMDYTVSFASARKTDDEVTAINDAQWEFTLEELLPPGISEPPAPAEPFKLTVTRSNSTEVFTDCSWTSVRREDTIRGISQIRSGKAGGRSMIGFL